METREILDDIYPLIDRAEALEELAPQDRGDNYLLTCPDCHEREAYIYKAGVSIKCNRLNNCGYSKSLWDYLQERGSLSNQDTLKALARLADYTLPEREQSPEAQERAERARARANIMEAALDYFRAQLWSEAGRETLAYLRGRGYSEEDIRGMELGHFPGYQETSAYLEGKGYSRGELKSVFKWLKAREDYRLVFAYRSAGGALSGLWGRLTRPLKDGEKEERKYLPFSEASKDIPFNFHRARGQKELTLVEGYLDALIATQRGLKGVIALGQARLSRTQLETLTRYGAESFILALDGDRAGREGAEGAVRAIMEKWEPGKRLRASVVTLPEGQDPDGLITSEGLEAFSSLVAQAQGGAKWLGYHLAARNETKEKWERGNSGAFEEALETTGKIRNPLELGLFREAFGEGLGIPESFKGFLEENFEGYRQAQEKERLRGDYRQALKKGSKLAESGEPSELVEHLEGALKALRPKVITRSFEPYTLATLEEDIRRAKAGLGTGYPSLDKLVTIPQEALTIVGARPSHGKTTLLFNLLLNMVEAHPERAFFFFSYEETRKQIGLKLLHRLAGSRDDKSLESLEMLERYLRGGAKYSSEVETAKKGFEELTGASGRLWIIDEPLQVGELRDTLANLSEGREVGAVFVDYIQKVKSGDRYQTRQLELQKICEGLLETAKGLSLPILLGAQLGRDKERADKVRLDNLREAGDIEQDASLVLGLYNEAMEKAQGEAAERPPEIVDLKVTVLKNRNGPVNDEVTLEFNRPLLAIKDKSETRRES